MTEATAPEARPERGGSVRRLLGWTRNATALVLVLALAGLAAGAWSGVRQAAQREATAVVLLSPLDGNPFSPSGSGSNLVNLETEAQLVRSDAVAGDVIEDLDLDVTTAELLEGISVEVPVNTQIVRISAVHSSEDEAVARAQAFADSFLQFRRSRARGSAKKQAAQLSEQIDEQQKQLNVRNQRITQMDPLSPQAVLLREQIVESTTKLGELRAQLAALEALRADPGEVVTPAQPPESGWLGSTAVLALVGLLLGAGVGVALLAVRARRDGRIRDVADLEGTGVPVLGEITDGGGGADLATSAVRSAVLATLPQRPLVLGVVGVDADVHVADELAWSMARARHEVVLVELADGPDSREGLSDLLLEVATVDDVVRPVTSHLSRVVAGSSPDRLPDLLGSPGMAQVVEDLGKRSDVVVIDAGAVHEPRARALVRHTHGVVLEVHAGATEVQQVATARSMVWAAGGEVVGVVMVRSAARAAAPAD